MPCVLRAPKKTSDQQNKVSQELRCRDPQKSGKRLVNQARKRHININFLVRLLLGRPRECLGDKPGLPPGQTHFVPGTIPGFLLILHTGSPVCPRALSLGQPGNEGQPKSSCAKSLCAFFQGGPGSVRGYGLVTVWGWNGRFERLRFSVPVRFL